MFSGLATLIKSYSKVKYRIISFLLIGMDKQEALSKTFLSTILATSPYLWRTFSLRSKASQIAQFHSINEIGKNRALNYEFRCFQHEENMHPQIEL